MRVPFTTALIIGALFAGLPALAAAQAQKPSLSDEMRRPELRLTAAQRQALERLETESRAETRRIKQQIDNLRRQLDTVYRSYALDLNRVRLLHRDIGQAQARLLDVHLETQQRLRVILTPTQFFALQSALRDEEDEDASDAEERRPGAPGGKERPQSRRDALHLLLY